MRIVNIVGARPQFIKAAVVSRALRALPGVVERLVHAGQHYDANMSAVFFDELAIPQADCDLGIGSGPHGAQTGRMLAAIEEVLVADRPDWASDLLFAPTQAAVKHLLGEGIPVARVQLVGDVMFDAARFYADRAAQRSHVLERVGVERGRYVLATVHRAENTNDTVRLLALFDGLSLVTDELPVVAPLHPRTRAALARAGALERLCGALKLIDPVGYLDMAMLEQCAAVIATDSGGVQKEAFFYQVPCVTLRGETE